MPAIALAFVAAKAGCFILGSLIHEASEHLKHFGVDHDATAKASCLLIKDEQLRLQETPNETPSNALILYVSREIVLSSSSSSRALAILRNGALAIETPFDVIENFSLSIMNSFNLFSAWAWIRTRFIAVIQSALSSVITDMKMAMSSFIDSASESVIEKKEVASIVFLIQANTSRIMVQVVVILKEATRLLKIRSERNMSTLVGQIFPVGIRGKTRCFDLLPDSNSAGDSITVDVGTCTQKYIAKVITCFKAMRALETLSDYFASLLRPLRLHGLKVMTMVLLLFVSIALIGWSIPLMIFEGCKPEQGILQKTLFVPEPEAVSEVEACAFSSITPLFAYLSDGTSNALDLMESISNFDNMQSTLMTTGGKDGQIDLNHLGPADFIPSLHLWPAKDFSFSTTSTPDLQTDFLWDDEAAAVSLVDWNIDAYHCIQSKPGDAVGFGTALESSLPVHVLELVPGEDHASNGIATESLNGYSLFAFADEDVVLRFIPEALQDQSSVELELDCPPPSSSASNGDTPTTPMIIIIAAGPPQEEELSMINYLSREFDGYSDPLLVEDRCSNSTAVQVHETHTDLDHPGSVLLWSSNDLIAANSSQRHSGYFWNHMAAVILRLDWNTEVSSCIQSESTSFICALRKISSDRFQARTSQIVLVVAKAFDGYTVSAIADETLTFTSSFVAQASHNQSPAAVESLGRSIISSIISDGNTLSMSMQKIVAGMGASNEISPIQCRDSYRSTSSELTRTPPLPRLPAPLDRNRASLSIRSCKMFSAAVPPSLKFGALEESISPDIFCGLRKLAWILLMLAYRNSDGATKENCALFSSESELSPGTNLDLEEVCDEMIFADEENGADEVLLRNTNSKPSRHEVIALHSELGRHWKSPSKRRMRRSSRFRSRPEYFEPTWA